MQLKHFKLNMARQISHKIAAKLELPYNKPFTFESLVNFCRNIARQDSYHFFVKFLKDKKNYLTKLKEK